MRNFINIFALVALVITTTMAPAVSHAMPRHGAKAIQTKTEAAKGHDCHGHSDVKAEKAGPNDKYVSNHCCDKGMCKCVGGNCHSLSKYFSNGTNSIVALSSSRTVFAFDNQFVDSALPSLLKRPPKA